MHHRGVQHKNRAKWKKCNKKTIEHEKSITSRLQQGRIKYGKNVQK